MEILIRRFLFLVLLTNPLLTADQIHSLHAAKLGALDCKLCHAPVSRGSVELARPGHQQCQLCHAAAFQAGAVPGRMCAECHVAPAPSGTDLVAFPRNQNAGAILAGFSHARHIDSKARVDAATHLRSDCVFCHSTEVRVPGHKECAACHSKNGVKPELTPFLRTAGCLGCHQPLREQPSILAPRYSGIRFSHASHLNAAIGCGTCHESILKSVGIIDQQLPRMADCASCHDTRSVPAQFRLSNCGVCHTTVSVSDVATNFNRNIKPESHTAAFRQHHDEAAASLDAKCFACHQNSLAGPAAKDRCVSCHMVMRPVSHSARWKDDIHGKWAAMDRTACAICHSADYCSRCHNELPRSHAPLPIFKAGGHAHLAMLNNRACFTCHTFQDTCASCHVRTLGPGAVRR